MIEWAVEVAKLGIAEAEILQAVEAYRAAAERAKTAADALAADWSGDAQAAFVAEQAKAYGWHISIADIVHAFAETLKDSSSKYAEAEEAICSIIKGR